MRTNTLLKYAALCALLLALAPSCGGVDDAVDTCVPGKVESCPCEGDEPDGTQTCDDDGTWDGCDCGSTDSDTDVDSDTDADSDTDTEYGPCDELMDLYIEILEEVCADFPDCSLCEEDVIDTDAEQPSDEECQQALDETDWDDMMELFIMACEAEEQG